MENILKIREQVRKLTMNISLGFMEYKELQPIVNEISKLTDEEVSIQKCALEEGYYWISRKGFNSKEIAKYDSDNELFFLIGSNYGLKLSEINSKERVRDYSERASEKCNLANINNQRKLLQKYHCYLLQNPNKKECLATISEFLLLQ